MAAVAAAWALKEVDLMSVDSISILEASVREQATLDTYYAKGNRALFKLYQQHPMRVDNDCVTLVLVKALAALPDPDFLLCMYLLPEGAQASESVVTLAALERLLQMGQFAAFWSKTKVPTTRVLLDQVTGLDAAVRGFIAAVIARTYQRIGSTVLSAELDLEDVPTFANARGWSTDGNSFVLPPTLENLPRAKKVTDEGIKYGEMAGVVATLTR